MFNIPKKLRDFRRDQRGTATIEALFVLPFLAWSIVAMAIYFDAFRVKTLNLKASYTISDMLSRITPDVDGDFIDGLKVTFDYLIESPNPTWIRATMIQFDTENPANDFDGKYILMWSDGTAGKPALTPDTLFNLEKHIPIMGDGDSLIIIETYMKYVPAYDIGIAAYDLNNVVVTRPRFTPPCWESCI